MTKLKRCRFSKKYLETYKSDKLKVAASKKRGILKSVSGDNLVVLWNGTQQAIYHHKDCIEFI
jgi:hypothetical protein